MRLLINLIPVSLFGLILKRFLINFTPVSLFGLILKIIPTPHPKGPTPHARPLGWGLY